MDASEPYTGAMRSTVHEPSANLGADPNFSLVRLKTRKGGITKIRVEKKRKKNNK